MKKLYSFVALMVALFTATSASAQIQSVAELSGTWKFTADVQFNDDSYKSKILNENEVKIQQNPSAIYAAEYEATAVVTYDLSEGKTPVSGPIKIQYDKDYGIYLITNFLGYNTSDLNYGGIELKPDAEDPMKATIDLEYNYLEFLEETAVDYKYYVLLDGNLSNGPIKVTFSEDGTMKLGEFCIGTGTYMGREPNALVTWYSSLTAVPKYPFPVIETPVTGVTLDKTEVEMSVLETLILTATVVPDNATYKTVTWSSDNTAVATVDNNGVVTSVMSGTALITATATNGTDDPTDDKTATCSVTVNDKCELKYGHQYSTDIDLRVKDFSYTFPFYPNVWNSWFVPFEITTGELGDKDFTAAYIAGVRQYEKDAEGNVITQVDVIKIKNGKLRAGTPYLIKQESDATEPLIAEFNKTGTTLKKSSDVNNIHTETATAKYDFIGTYSEIANKDAKADYILSSNGAFVHPSSPVYPMNWYMKVTPKGDVFDDLSTSSLQSPSSSM